MEVDLDIKWLLFSLYLDTFALSTVAEMHRYRLNYGDLFHSTLGETLTLVLCIVVKPEMSPPLRHDSMVPKEPHPMTLWGVL